MIRESDNDRQYRVINQMLTAHSVLRDRCKRRAFVISTGILALSVALNAFVFASDDMLRLIFRGHVDFGKLGLQITSVFLLILSIIELKVNWAAEGGSRDEALKRLARLKAKYREVFGRQRDEASQNELTREYARTMEEIPAIPEKLFAKLKATHEFKCLLSKRISAHPGVPHWILAVLLQLKATLNASKEKE